MQTLKLLAFSDSHGDSRRMELALRAHPNAEGVLFLGDGLDGAAALLSGDSSRFFLGVRGNCDGMLFAALGRSAQASEKETITLLGHRILLVHGHREGVKAGLGGLIASARREGASLALFGHTHIPHSEYLSHPEPPLYLFNPGSISRPARGEPSYGIITLSEGGILLSHGFLPDAR